MSEQVSVLLDYAGRGYLSRSCKTLSLKLCCFVLFNLTAVASYSQQPATGTASIVQPGAPGAPSKKLPPSTSAVLPSPSQADVDFMQGMIMHHAQAVEMTALIPSHTENKEVRSLGARISLSQSDEIKFMKRW